MTTLDTRPVARPEPGRAIETPLPPPVGPLRHPRFMPGERLGIPATGPIWDS